MVLRKVILVCFFIYHVFFGFSQNYFSYGGSNYNGVLQLISNPASAAGNKLKVDVLLAGFDITFNNSWVGIKRGSLSFPKLPASWRNYTPNLDDNVYKNFTWHQNPDAREVFFEQRILLPSALVRINSKNSVAFSSGIRQIGNITGVSPALAALFEKEFDLSVLQNNPVQNKNFSAIRMSWIEYGITYARELYRNEKHCFKAGVTPKLLQGLESSYFIMRNLNFLFSNKDTLSYLEADFSTAHSARSGSVLDITGNAGDRFRNSSQLNAGLDAGFIYELKKDENSAAYKLKVGASLIDLGSITFKKEPNYYDLNFSIRQTDIIRYIGAENVKMIDSLLHHDFPANTGDDHFKVKMPTTLNLQVDYSFFTHWYLNFGAHLPVFNQGDDLKISTYRSFCIAPRFESYWLDASLIFGYNALSAQRSQLIVPGFNIRMGPLTIGSSDLSSLYTKDISSLNFYAMLRVSIPSRTSAKAETMPDTPK
jgi:hypothetical protein